MKNRFENQNLEDWFLKQKEKEFPGGVDYVLRYRGISDYLRTNIFPLVATGAAVASATRAAGPFFLNDHGRDHIVKVIETATLLLKLNDCNLSAYEAYFLLCAINLHDAGNLFGREGHEKKIDEIIETMGSIVGSDPLEKRIIRKIAGAHGGKVKSTQTGEMTNDTISELLTNAKNLSRNIRKQVLAAILRFADELADDRSRAARFPLEAGTLGGSEIFHVYSNSLRSVDVEGNAVSLEFEMTKDTAIRKIKKGQSSVFLLDEIFERTVKMHSERMYCMRFLRPMINIDKISVKIEIFESLSGHNAQNKPLKTISYILLETGYPDHSNKQIDSLCPNLRGQNGKTLKKSLLRSPQHDEQRVI